MPTSNHEASKPRQRAANPRQRPAAKRAAPKVTVPRLTARQVQALPNDELLALMKLVDRDVIRRIGAYDDAASTPVAMLDGIKFAQKADRISRDLRHGSSYPHCLHHAVGHLTSRLADLEYDRGLDENGGSR